MKYSIGEKVCFYDSGEKRYGVICETPRVFNSGIYEVIYDDIAFNIHEKQMRKLKPKKKPRIFYLNRETKDSPLFAVSCPIEGSYEIIKVKEVLK